jgi:hypothetical protein
MPFLADFEAGWTKCRLSANDCLAPIRAVQGRAASLLNEVWFSLIHVSGPAATTLDRYAIALNWQRLRSVIWDISAFLLSRAIRGRFATLLQKLSRSANAYFGIWQNP